MPLLLHSAQPHPALGLTPSNCFMMFVSIDAVSLGFIGAVASEVEFTLASTKTEGEKRVLTPLEIGIDRSPFDAAPAPFAASKSCFAGTADTATDGGSLFSAIDSFPPSFVPLSFVSNLPSVVNNLTAPGMFNRPANIRRQSGSVSSGSHPWAEAKIARRTVAEFKAWPRRTCKLINRAATPETTAAAILVPPITAVPPPRAAPTIPTAGARIPCSRYFIPQLLKSKGDLSSSIAPTASTEGKAPGIWRHSQPSLPAALTISAPFSAQNVTASANSGYASPEAEYCPPLTLITFAPACAAWRIARAKSTWEQGIISAIWPVFEHRDDQARTIRDYPSNWPVVPTKKDTRHVCPVLKRRTTVVPVANERLQGLDRRTGEAGVIEIDRTVQHRDADTGLAQRLRPNGANA